MASITYTLELAPTAEGAPYYANIAGPRLSDDAGVDLFVVSGALVAVGEPCLLSLGVRARMVRDDTGESVHFTVEPRSSIFKARLVMANSRGVIDRSYRGELRAPVWAAPGCAAASVQAGTRLFQVLAPGLGNITFVRMTSASAWDATERGEGGFGSTGTR